MCVQEYGGGGTEAAAVTSLARVKEIQRVAAGQLTITMSEREICIFTCKPQNKQNSLDFFIPRRKLLLTFLKKMFLGERDGEL